MFCTGASAWGQGCSTHPHVVSEKYYETSENELFKNLFSKFPWGEVLGAYLNDGLAEQSYYIY